MSVISPVSFNDVLNSDQAPSLPEVALKIIRIAQSPDPDIIELVQVVKGDPATAGRVLKFANSALFGLRHRSSSVEAAVPLLGTTLVRTLVLGFSLAQHSAAFDDIKPWFRRLWREALFQASAAEVLAEKTGGSDPPTWFLAALLQDVGQLAMLNEAGIDYVNTVLEVNSSTSRLEREVDHFGFSHVDVSIALCQKWNFETELITAIAGHHESVTIDGDRQPSMQTGLCTAAACSEYMDAIGQRLTASRSDVEHLMIEGYGFLPDEIPCILAECDARALELGAGFSIDVRQLPVRDGLLDQAQTVLRQIAMENRLQVLAGSTIRADSQTTKTSDWTDTTVDAHNQQYLDDALPRELERSHADGATISLLQVDASCDCEEAEAAMQKEDFISVVTDCVRPSDCVISTGDKTTVIILQRLNFDILHRIAERIQSELHRRLGLTTRTRISPSVGGVMVVPAGRRAAASRKVLKALADSTDTARQVTSSGIAFQLLMGRKAQRLNKDEYSA